MTTGWRCAVCGTAVDVAAVHAFRCPRATPDDWRHVLQPVSGPAAHGDVAELAMHPNSLARYGPASAWWAFAGAHGMSTAERVALAEQLGAGFVVTPLRAHDLALDPAQPTASTVWVKDETGNVGGSHKGRHLVGILLHLRAAELLGVAPYGAARPPLAIASCGNAAIAAATLARAAEWPLQVFVPEWASPSVLATLEQLGATVNVCPRTEDDPPGDPSVRRCRAAIVAGALPFTVQGTDNALCLDTGRTLGWELADAAGAATMGPDRLDRVVVQVGGGALAACVGWGLGPAVRLDTVQADGCAPLARAWFRAKDLGLSAADWGRRWNELMTPWEHPASAADGILDDETYDWLGVADAMHRSWGRPIVAPEEAIVHAHRLAVATGIPVSVTGSAGLAGLLVTDGRPRPDERVAVIFSGVSR